MSTWPSAAAAADMHAAGAAGSAKSRSTLRGRAELVRERRHAGGIGAPGLAGVVRHEALDEHVRAELAQPPRDRVADPGAAAAPR